MYRGPWYEMMSIQVCRVENDFHHSPPDETINQHNEQCRRTVHHGNYKNEENMGHVRRREGLDCRERRVLRPPRSQQIEFIDALVLAHNVFQFEAAGALD